MPCLQAIDGEDTENLFICHIMNLLWSLSDKDTRVRFCWPTRSRVIATSSALVKSLNFLGFDFLFRTRPRALRQQTPAEPVLVPLAKGRPFYSNDWIWLHQVTVPTSGDGSTLRTASNTVEMMWDKIEFNLKFIIDTSAQHVSYKPKIKGPHRCSSKEWEVKRIILILALMCFLLNNLWSVCHYIMGPFSGWQDCYHCHL